MIVHKVLNNNIVSSLDERGREVLLVGRGLGWQAKPGEAIDKKKIDKIFRMDTGASTEKLKQLIQDYLKKQYNFILSAEEITFLTVHIVRVTTKL